MVSIVKIKLPLQVVKDKTDSVFRNKVTRHCQGHRRRWLFSSLTSADMLILQHLWSFREAAFQPVLVLSIAALLRHSVRI